MPPHRVPPPFPQPFASTGTAYPAQNATGTPEQRSIGSTQGSAYPPDHSPRDTPNLMPPPYTSPRHPSAHIPAYQPTQDSVPTHPAFPMPQVPDLRVPGPPPVVQRSETAHFPGHLNHPQVAPGSYASYPLQASGHLNHTQVAPESYASYPPQTSGHLNHTQVAPGSYASYPPQASSSMPQLPSQHGSGMTGAAHFAPPAQRNQDDSDNEDDRPPQMNNSNFRPKGPPNVFASGIPAAARKTKCPACGRVCSEIDVYCSIECANRGQRHK